jgi:hypothetical protein
MRSKAILAGVVAFWAAAANAAVVPGSSFSGASPESNGTDPYGNPWQFATKTQPPPP